MLPSVLRVIIPPLNLRAWFIVSSSRGFAFFPNFNNSSSSLAANSLLAKKSVLSVCKLITLKLSLLVIYIRQGLNVKSLVLSLTL